MPPASVICELANPPPEYLGITLTGPVRPAIAEVESVDEEDVVAAFVELGAARIGSETGALSVAEWVVALANAETGKPPRV